MRGSQMDLLKTIDEDEFGIRNTTWEEMYVSLIVRHKEMYIAPLPKVLSNEMCQYPRLGMISNGRKVVNQLDEWLEIIPSIRLKKTHDRAVLKLAARARDR